jgi:hypothetical protein
MLELMLRLYLRLTTDDGERGDVPGWVLITLMTAGLVMAIWGSIYKQDRMAATRSRSETPPSRNLASPPQTRRSAPYPGVFVTRMA